MNADILVSTEMCCWTDHDCLEKDLKRFYANDVGHTSNYVNSALMGTVSALADVLTVSHSQLYEYTIDLYDQVAVTMIATFNFTTQGNWKIRRDFNQVFFGSTAFCQKSMPLCPPSPQRRFTCYDAILQAHIEKDCCVNDNIEWEVQKTMFGVTRHNHEFACDAIRSNEKDQFYSPSFMGFELRPFVFHCNGGGKAILNHLKDHMIRCLNNLNKEDVASSRHE